MICVFIYLLVIYVFIVLKSLPLLCWRWSSEPGACWPGPRGELLPPTPHSLGLWDSPHLPRIPRGFHRNKGLIRGNHEASLDVPGALSGPQRLGSLTPLFPTFDLQHTNLNLNLESSLNVGRLSSEQISMGYSDHQTSESCQLQGHVILPGDQLRGHLR